MMKIAHPYQGEGRWYRGNLHAHTSESPCGHVDLSELARAYRQFDYDFLCISDHFYPTDLRDTLVEGLTLLPGVELKARNAHFLTVGVTENLEYVAHGLPAGIKPYEDVERGGDYPEIAALARSRGGLTIASHPHWREENYWSLAALAAIPDLTGLEIYNGHLIFRNSGRPLATDLWDALLTLGRVLWGYANDDFHRWGDLGRAWNMVLAPSASPHDLLASLARGSFYATTGAEFQRIAVEGDTLVLTLTMPGVLRLVGVGGREIAATTGLELRHDLAGLGGYVRAEACLEDGRMAWTQPFFVAAGGAREERR